MGKKNAAKEKEKAPAAPAEPEPIVEPAPEPKPPVEVLYCSGALDISTQILPHYR